jgi:predicted restriction endonuclease
LSDEHVFELTAVPLDEGMIAARDLVELYFEGEEPDRLKPSSKEAAQEARPDPYVQAEKEVLPVQRVYVSASRQVRDQKIISLIRRLYRDKCAVCGQALPMARKGSTFSEVGHIKPVGLPFRGPDHVSNVLPFCPNHHRQFDRGAVCFEVDGNNARVVDRSPGSSIRGRVFAPVAGHPLNMSMLEWHAHYFRHR